MKKTMSNKNLFLILIAITYITAFALCAIIKDINGKFIEGLVFLTVSAAVAAGVILVYASKGTDIRDVFFRMPIYIIGTGYYAVAGATSVIYMLLGILPFKLLLFLQIIYIAAFAALLISALVTVNTADNAIENVRLRKDFISAMTSKVSNAAANAQDRELRLKLESLAEEFKYSKPIIHKELIEIEAKIEMSVDELDAAVLSGENAAESIRAVKSLLLQRNNTAKLLK